MEFFLGLIVLFIIVFTLVKDYYKKDKNSKKDKHIVNKKKNVNYIENNKEDNKEDRRLTIKSIDEIEKIKNIETLEYIKEEIDYVKPNISLLDDGEKDNVSGDEIKNKIKIIDDTLNSFKINAKVCNVNISTLVSVFEIEISPNTNVDKIKNIFDNFKVALGNKKIRLIIPIPGKNTIGIEVPNDYESKIVLKDMLSDIPDKYKNSNILIPVGIDSYGKKKYFDLSDYQNLLVVGSPGSGKKNFLHSIITSSLINNTPNELKIIIIDNSKTEFAVYESANYMVNVISDSKKIESTFKTISNKMNERKEELSTCNSKDIYEYNKQGGKLINFESILLIINSYSDIYQSNKAINNYINEIINNGKNLGVNLILCANNSYSKFDKYIDELDFNSVILFKSNNDFKYNKVTDNDILLGNGDMFCKLYGEKDITRLQSPYITFDESKRIVNFIKENNNRPRYSDSFDNFESDNESSGSVSGGESSSEQKDVLYDEILNYAIRMGQISASLIQRKYSIGYNRAARIMDMFEEKGIVGPAKGSNPRKVLVKLGDESEI